MKIEKSSSNYLILDSGTAMTFDNQATLQLKLVLDQSFYFTVQILFKKGDGGERELMQSVDTETNTISLSCKNFGYTGALKAPVRCFGNHLSGQRKSQFRTDNECGGAAILKDRTSRMVSLIGC